jgi:hypothetical protein
MAGFRAAPRRAGNRPPARFTAILCDDATQ